MCNLKIVLVITRCTFIPVEDHCFQASKKRCALIQHNLFYFIPSSFFPPPESVCSSIAYLLLVVLGLQVASEAKKPSDSKPGRLLFG